MEFEWDKTKNKRNRKKHNIDFADAICIFDGFVVRHKSDGRDYGEERRKVTGTLDGDMIAVIYTKRENRRRIISARPASREERRYHYEQSS